MEKQFAQWRGRLGFEYSLLQSMMDPRPSWARKLGFEDFDGLFPTIPRDKKKKYFWDNQYIPEETKKRADERYRSYFQLLLEQLEGR